MAKLKKQKRCARISDLPEPLFSRFMEKTKDAALAISRQVCEVCGGPVPEITSFEQLDLLEAVPYIYVFNHTEEGVERIYRGIELVGYLKCYKGHKLVSEMLISDELLSESFSRPELTTIYKTLRQVYYD